MDESFRLKEERLNALSHGIGAALSAFGLVLLLQRAALFEDFAYTISNAVYGLSFCMVYLSSTLLHCSRSRKWAERFEMLDHAAIFIAIAGSYTPFLMITLQGTLGYSMLLLVWLLALGGVRYIKFIIRRFIPWGLLLYLLLAGFMASLIAPLQERLPLMAITWIVTGVILYSIGLLFFLWRKLRYHHLVWHVFVVAGSSCHFIAVYAYVMPAVL
ncbi:hemolysin III family protein [Paenibacillus chondroitinus]|uniref:Hemolysin III family protein n=1 Tax=Paenibacillus chondroitinus TaxID=59842 RepID=A0ABU6DEB5_9BACL|nr:MULTISPECIES: hemolysin III family protein [Paenibacillus]MCY9658684.1 hemolysin III family protein [Paenibacillus anseongense]MEB4796091.1 hemolysin III family protein [Paenibacillus chondroitinus]